MNDKAEALSVNLRPDEFIVLYIDNSNIAKSIAILVSSNWKVLYLTTLRSIEAEVTEWLMWLLLRIVWLLLRLRLSSSLGILFLIERGFRLLILRGLLLFLWFLNHIAAFSLWSELNSIFTNADFLAQVLLLLNWTAKHNLETLLINSIDVVEYLIYQIPAFLLILDFLTQING